MKLNFLYVADDVYFNLMRLSVISAVKYHKGAIFHIFTMDSPETKQVKITKKNIEKLQREIKCLDPTAQLIIYDVRDTYIKKLGNSVNQYSRFTPYAALRLLAPYIIKDVDLLLYLDADTLVVDKLFELFSDELVHQDFDIAATAGVTNDGIQSGSLVFNLRYQRETNLTFINDAISLYNSNIYRFPDQDAISHARKTAIILHGRYMQQNYATDTINKPKIMCVCYRNSEDIRTFLKQSVFRLDAQRLYGMIDRIAKLISDIQN